MSTALEAVSLIMIPTSYSDGLLASVKPNDGAGDFTFSRGSNISATRVNADGNIEKGYENLLLQSNNFSTTWFNSNSTETSGQGGYDGSSDAWLISKSAAGGYIGQNISQSGVQTFSIYAKANDSDYMSVIGSAYQVFNLSNGTLGVGNAIDAKIESIGSGWYRCSMTENASITRVRIFPVEANSSSATSGSIYIQDAMLNQGLVAYPYVETTTAPVASGILEDMPRIDFSGGNQSLLLEPSRTNLIAYSEYLEGNSIFQNLSTNYNATISPEGLQNATKVTATGSGKHEYGDYPSVSSGVGVVGSVFVKADTTEYVQLYLGGGPASGSPYANFFIGENPSVEREIDLTASIEDYGNGWLRLIIKQTTDGSGIIAFAAMPIPNGTIGRAASYTANGESIFTYGLQLEQDATYPTSYIPTYGVSQTRLGDVLGNSNNISGLFSSNQGTLYLETNDTIFKDETSNKNFFGLTESSSGSYFRFRGADTTILAQSGGFGSTISFNPNGATFTKYLYKWDGTNIKVFIDGVERGSVSQTGTFNPNLFRIGFDFGFVSNTKQLLIFPTALSDEECITLTTI